MSTTILHPSYYRVIRREGTKWFVKGAKLLSPNDVPIGLDDLEQKYGMTNLDLVMSLFRINGGKAGYYLANLISKQYYYCGMNLEDVKATLQGLGIGRPDPVG